MSQTTITPQFEDVHTVRFEGETVDVAGVNVTAQPSILVIGGEYRDEPDMCVEVRYAVDEDGNDITQDVARVIAELLSK